MPLKNKPTFKKGDRGAAVTVRVQMNSGKARFNKILEDGTIVIDLPNDGSMENTNKALVSFLASSLKIKSNQVEVLGGIGSQDKLISLIGIDPDQVDLLVLKKMSSD
jgi:uncharacterized protein YggU (UPF0235/DUF167 family)